MSEDTWRERLRAAIDASGKSMREISLEAGRSPGYVFALLSGEQEPTINPLMKVIDAAGGSASHILLGIGTSAEDDALMKAIGRLNDSERVALRQMIEAMRPTKD